MVVIPIPVGRSYTATLTASWMNEVTCDSCGCNYVYLMTGTARGGATSPLFLDNAGAAERAREKAQYALSKMRTTKTRPVPCPKCGWYQSDMVRASKRRGVYWILVPCLIPCFVLLFRLAYLAGCLSSDYPASNLMPTLCWIAFAAAFAGTSTFAWYRVHDLNAPSSVDCDSRARSSMGLDKGAIPSLSASEAQAILLREPAYAPLGYRERRFLGVWSASLALCVTAYFVVEQVRQSRAEMSKRASIAKTAIDEAQRAYDAKEYDVASRCLSNLRPSVIEWRDAGLQANWERLHRSVVETQLSKAESLIQQENLRRAGECLGIVKTAIDASTETAFSMRCNQLMEKIRETRQALGGNYVAAMRKYVEAGDPTAVHLDGSFEVSERVVHKLLDSEGECRSLAVNFSIRNQSNAYVVGVRVRGEITVYREPFKSDHGAIAGEKRYVIRGMPIDVKVMLPISPRGANKAILQVGVSPPLRVTLHPIAGREESFGGRLQIEEAWITKIGRDQFNQYLTLRDKYLSLGDDPLPDDLSSVAEICEYEKNRVRPDFWHTHTVEIPAPANGAEECNTVSLYIEMMWLAQGDERIAIIHKLAQLGREAIAAVPALKDMERDENAAVSQAAADAIEKIRDNSAELVK